MSKEVIEKRRNAPNLVFDVDNGSSSDNSSDVINFSSPNIKAEVLQMIVQYLEKESFLTSVTVLQDEANMKIAEMESITAQMKRLRKSILEGDWEWGCSFIKTLAKKHQKRFLYALYRQEFLELVEKQEHQKAFLYLNRRLKPLETLSDTIKGEFQGLCYLLTCKRVTDCPAFSNWKGTAAEREILAENIGKSLLLTVGNETFDGLNVSPDVPPNRLLTLLNQAAAYQMESKGSRCSNSKSANCMKSLLRNYSRKIVPKRVRHVFAGHTQSVKAVEWCGQSGFLLAGGGNGRSISIWSSKPNAERISELSGRSGKISTDDVKDCIDHFGLDQKYDGRSSPPLFWLEGHVSKVWDLSSNESGTKLASASGDGNVRIWSLPGDEMLSSHSQMNSAKSGSDRLSKLQSSSFATASIYSASNHSGDCYSVEFHPNQSHLITGGFDRTVRLHDLRAEKEVRAFKGHTCGVMKATSNRHGSLLVSGARDGAICFWDVLSGVMVKSFDQRMGAVASVCVSHDGIGLLSASRYGSVRLWDLRYENQPIRQYRAGGGVSGSFSKAAFASDEALILRGTCDGKVLVWDKDSGDLLEKLEGHQGNVFQGAWNERQGLVATCGDDGTVKTWCCDAL